jgi:ectonucleotide pyrophosphatase/phosphodiesterase family member 5
VRHGPVIRRFFALSWLILTAFLAVEGRTQQHSSESRQQAPEGKPLVVLIGLDGFRADYLARGHAPVLQSLAQQGLLVKGLVPVFPSLTFPNHISLVTGVHPGQHGIVNNNMRDPMRSERFRLGSSAVMQDPFWWSEAKPIWTTLKRQGKRSATLFWPGSEVRIQGLQPDHWLPYEHGMSHEKRVELLLQWLDRPDEDRADFATIYFSDVDSMGHAKGPDSEEVNRAIAKVDASIASLMAGLQKLGLLARTSFVIAADHGMRFVPMVNTIDAEAITAKFPKVRWEWFGATSGLDLNGEDEAALLARLNAEPHLRCWPKAALPSRLGLAAHRRAPDLVCLAAPGYSVAPNRFKPGPLGQHGFDPEDEQMHGLLIVSGHRIRPSRLDLVSVLDVYPLLCALLGIRGEPHQGSDRLVQAGLLTKMP